MNQVLTLCGFVNPADRARLVDIKGLDTLDAFGDFSDDSIEHMARKYERPGPDQMRFGIRRIVKMKAIAFWDFWSVKTRVRIPRGNYYE
jgi:hypothetical protein